MSIWSAMSSAITASCQAVETTANAINSGANAVNYLAKTAEKHAEIYHLEADMTYQTKRVQLDSDLKKLMLEMDNTIEAETKVVKKK